MRSFRNSGSTGSKPIARTVFAVATVALLASACGSGGGNGPALVPTDKDFVSCLSGHPDEFSHASGKDADYLAQTAAAYAAVTTVDGNHVNVSIWRSVRQAQGAEDSYRATGAGEGLLEQRSNVVIVWDTRPTGRQKADLERCVFR